MLNKNVFPSLQRRGGRAIKRMMPKATKVGADGVVSPRNVFEMRSKHLISIDHPVCAVIGGLRHLFIGGAATPPLQVFARRGIRFSNTNNRHGEDFGEPD